MNNRKKIRLSPSRINSVNDCSWQYYANYHMRLPRFSNDGSRRGSICHDLLECLVKKNHRHYVKEILDEGDVYMFPAIKKFIEIHAKKEGLSIDQVVVNKDKNGLMTHRDEINNMLIVALRNDFLGKPGDEILSEIKHKVEIDDKEKKYFILGIIDKVFIRRNKKNEIVEVEIIDYKTSSKKYSMTDIDSNLQGLVYQFFAKDMFPNVKNIKFKFLFLRFPKSPVIEVPQLPDKNGFEHYLSYITKYMESFTENHAKKNFAKNNISTKFLCGMSGNKKYYDKELKKKVEHNEPQFMCALRNPFDYYAIIDEDGNNIRSAISEEELKAKANEIVIKRHYYGCPAWHAQKKNLNRDWSILQ